MTRRVGVVAWTLKWTAALSWACAQY